MCQQHLTVVRKRLEKRIESLLPQSLSKRVCVIAKRVGLKIQTPPKLRPRLSEETKAAVNSLQ